MITLGNIHQHLKTMVIIPLNKPNKDRHSLDSVRPITLLNTVAKILEKLIIEWLYEMVKDELFVYVILFFGRGCLQISLMIIQLILLVYCS